MKRVKLTVAYEGTAYAGWQIQKNAVSVEEVLNGAISELVGEDITVTGASRRHAGDHALGNVAVFDTESRIPADKFSYALNERLPEDIRIQGSCEVAPDFHPRYCESVKTYEYCILNHRFQIPAYRHNRYFYHRPRWLHPGQDHRRFQEPAAHGTFYGRRRPALPLGNIRRHGCMPESDRIFRSCFRLGQRHFPDRRVPVSERNRRRKG